MDYESIARDFEYGVLKCANGLFFWVCYDDTSENTYSSAEEAWQACCHENGLLEV
jgi:hypothetical protein